MERITINLNSPIYGMEELNVSSIEEHTDYLAIKIQNKGHYGIVPGDVLTFNRKIYRKGGSYHTLMETVNVIKKEKNTLYTSKIPNKQYYLENGYDNVTYISGTTETDGVVNSYEYYILKTKQNHDLFLQDLGWNDNPIGDGQEIYVYNIDKEIIGSFSGLSAVQSFSDDKATSADCLTFIGFEETCHKEYDRIKTYEYSFLTDKISRNRIIVKDFIPYITDNMVYFETKFNPFYWYRIEKDEKGEPLKRDEYGNAIKKCTLYTDTLWENYESINNNNGEAFINNGNTTCSLLKENGYWNVNVDLSTPSDENNLGIEDNFSEGYIKDLEDSLIPYFIDMERVKYVPMSYTPNSSNKLYKWTTNDIINNNVIYTKKWVCEKNTTYNGTVNVYDENGGSLDINAVWRDGYLITDNAVYTQTNEIIRNDLTIATSITLNYHFRKRVEVKDVATPNNSLLTSGNVYCDGWYIDNERGDSVWWNGIDYNEERFSTPLDTFINKSGETSDLIGYLNFTDKDIFYKKKKVSQSFARLSFYTSKDPLTQKLLYYSTVFLDSSMLYGKYLKQYKYIQENGLEVSATNKNAMVVLCDDNSVSARLDTKMVITNEYDRTKSSEGFNLYLFESDTNINLDENGERTIYMKVEFNHAGNGKTIPMMAWPKGSDGGYTPLTVDNFFDSLYIPIKLSYFNKRYVYYIPDAFKDENGNISLVLFEPKLDAET